MASPRSLLASTTSIRRLAFASSPAARPASTRHTSSTQHGPRLPLNAGRALGRPQTHSLGQEAEHVCTKKLLAAQGLSGLPFASGGRIINVAGLRMCSSSVAGAAGTETLAVDLLGVDGRIATLKVREDGQGTMLQGLRVDFECGMSGTVVWQRTPLIFVLITDGDGGKEGVGKTATIPLTANVTVPTGSELVGRVVDSRGTPIDGGAPIPEGPRRSMFGMATLQRDMATISKPLHTGITGVDALTPIGRGQNMLVIGTLGGGRRAMAIDTVVQAGREGVSVVYVCLQADHKSIVQELTNKGAMKHTTVVVAKGKVHGYSGAAECVSAAATGTAIAEHIRQHGGDALVVVDDIETHRVFWDYTERQLLETFGVNAIASNASTMNAASSEMRAFYSSLFQRVGYLNNKAGGGSLSMLVLVDHDEAADAGKTKESYTMEDFDHPVYGLKVRERLKLMVDRGIVLTPQVLSKLSIPPPEVQTGDGRFERMRIEELMSMSDGQIVLSGDHLANGRRPPIDVRTSLTRIGIGHESLAVSSSPAMRAVASRLRFELAQASDVPKDDASAAAAQQRALALGWQAAMQQDYGHPRTLSESIVALFVAQKGYLKEMLKGGDKEFSKAVDAVANCIKHVHETCPEAMEEIETTKDISFKTKEAMTAALDSFFKK